MTTLYPRLSRSIAIQMFDELDDAIPPRELHHPSEVFAPVGGSRADDSHLSSVVATVESIANDHGFPNPIAPADRILFDRAVARALPELMPMTWSEAAAPDVWSFCAFMLLPDLTAWRFKGRNIERWAASDLTRHTWARYWWRGVVFADAWDAFEQLSESDLNQLLERRGLGGDIRLVSALSRHIVDAESELPRRALIRDVTRRLLRRLAFIDARALDEVALADLCTRTLAESIELLEAEPPSDLDVFEDEDDD